MLRKPGNLLHAIGTLLSLIFMASFVTGYFIPEIANDIGRSIRTVQRLRRRGVLPPAIQIGNRRMTPRQAIKDKLAKLYEEVAAT